MRGVAEAIAVMLNRDQPAAHELVRTVGGGKPTEFRIVPITQIPLVIRAGSFLPKQSSQNFPCGEGDSRRKKRSARGEPRLLASRMILLTHAMPDASTYSLLFLTTKKHGAQNRDQVG